MIKSIINSNKNYESNYNARERLPLSSLSNIINLELNIEEILNRMANSIINNRNDIPDMSDISDDILYYFSLLEEYFNMTSEIDIYISSNNKNYFKQDVNKLIPITLYNDDLISFDNENDITFEDIKNNINNIKRINSEYFNSLKTNYNNDPVTICKTLFNIKSYLIYLNYYLYCIICENDLDLYVKFSIDLINNNLLSKYYQMILKECLTINSGTTTSLISSIHLNSFNDIDNYFTSQITDISYNVNKFIVYFKNKVRDIMNSIREFDDNFELSINSKDLICLSSIINKNPEYECDLNFNEDLLIQPGNKYTKGNLIEFLNNVLMSIDIMKNNFDKTILDMNSNIIDMSDMSENNSSSIFDDNTIYIYSFSKHMSDEDLSKMAFRNINNNTKLENNIDKKYINLLDRLNLKYIRDDLIKFDLNSIKSYNNKYIRLYHDLIDFLSYKFVYINKKYIFNLSDIENLSNEYPNLIKNNLIPLYDDYMNKYILAINNKDGKIYVVKKDDQIKYKMVYTSLYSFISSL